MPRLFFALTLPESVSDRLDDLCEGLHDADWVTDLGYHLTLAFLGEVPPSQVEDAVLAGRGVQVAPFELEVGGVGTFPQRGKRRRVLWAGVRDAPTLAVLERRLRRELEAAGFALEKRPFHAHVTLARITDCEGADVDDWLARNSGLVERPFRVTSFHLIESVPGQHGREYRVLRSFALRS